MIYLNILGGCVKIEVLIISHVHVDLTGIVNIFKIIIIYQVIIFTLRIHFFNMNSNVS